MEDRSIVVRNSVLELGLSAPDASYVLFLVEEAGLPINRAVEMLNEFVALTTFDSKYQ